MEVFEGNQLFFEVLAIEFIEVIISKNPIIFKFLLKQFSNLLSSQLAFFKSVSRILGGTFEFILFMLDDLHPCLEEPVSLSFSDHCLLDNWELRHRFVSFHHQVLIQNLRRRAGRFGFAPLFLVGKADVRGFLGFLVDKLIHLVGLSVVDHLVSSLHFSVEVL